jgi:hypothetical protein
VHSNRKYTYWQIDFTAMGERMKKLLQQSNKNKAELIFFFCMLHVGKKKTPSTN